MPLKRLTVHGLKHHFLDENRDIVAIYMRYRDGEISKEQLKAIVTEFCDRRVDAIGNILSIDFNAYTGTLINELKSNLFRKLSRMRVLELSKMPCRKKTYTKISKQQSRVHYI